MSSVDGVRARIVLANASMEWGAASASRIMGVSRCKARYSKALDPDFHPGRHGGRTYSTLPRPDQIALEWACYFMWRSVRVFVQKPGLTDAAVVQHLRDLGLTWQTLPIGLRTMTPVLSIWMKAISKAVIAHVGSVCPSQTQPHGSMALHCYMTPGPHKIMTVIEVGLTIFDYHSCKYFSKEVISGVGLLPLAEWLFPLDRGLS
eukprot:g60545.t1